MTAAEPGAAPGGSGVLHYVLTPDDAMAWEVRSPRVRRRDRVALGAAVFAGIGLIKVIGSNLPDLRLLHSLPMAFVLIALPVLGVKLLQRRDHRRRAVERVPAPVAVQLEFSEERIVERREDRRDAVAFGAAGLREVVAAPGHVCLGNGKDVVIVPNGAFATEAARAAFLRHWQARLD